MITVDDKTVKDIKTLKSSDYCCCNVADGSNLWFNYRCDFEQCMSQQQKSPLPSKTKRLVFYTTIKSRYLKQLE
jgi:hypothetical protein